MALSSLPSASACPTCGHQPYDPTEPLPETCDHCPRLLSPGQPFRRVQFVFDATPSIIQGPAGMAVEHQYNLVLCEPCAEALVRRATTKTLEESVSSDFCIEPNDSDEELAEALEQSQFILQPANQTPVQDATEVLEPMKAVDRAGELPSKEQLASLRARIANTPGKEGKKSQFILQPANQIPVQDATEVPEPLKMNVAMCSKVKVVDGKILYECGVCGKKGVKLWRLYQTTVAHQRLYCGRHACESRGVPYDIDAAGLVNAPHGRTDQIGNIDTLIPAALTVEEDTFWGYSSVPDDRVEWWKALPLE